ncbi:MAG: hypothetical protein P1P82_12450 [Bacteroidales bacterium]|nr:hypothetical protein [Bacteroidales bacterium]MDT8431697.1 hypothetical protein [Bacteroidales bacterium]
MTQKKERRKRFRMRDLPSLIKEAAVSWNRDDPWRLSAVVAYYAILSLPGLLVIIITMLSSFWGNEFVEGRIYEEIDEVMGKSAADSIRNTGLPPWRSVIRSGSSF